ncbi:MAG: ATP-grasp domain-containing protein [bacterium]|nr:ATP-grasp domain-containing protein [bacterium]
MKCLVVSGSAYLAHSVATCLWVAGHTVHILGNWRFSHYRLSRAHRRYEHFRPDGIEFEPVSGQLVDRVESYCAQHSIDLVVPADASAITAILRHTDRIRSARLFPLPTLAQFDLLNDKWSFAEVTEACGVGHPDTRLIRTVDDARNIDLPFPVVVKPLNRSGSQGLAVLSTPDRLRSHIASCETKGETPLIAQRFIEGCDMDATVLVDRGEVIAWAIQRRDIENSAVDFVRDDAVLNMVRTIASHVGYHGVLNIDVRYDARQRRPMAIEANPRFPGPLLFKLWAGVNFPAMGAALAYGDDPRATFTPPFGRCVNCGVSPRCLCKALLRGRLVPPGFSEYTETAWRANYRDPVAHLAAWFVDRFVKHPPHSIHTASRLEDAEELVGIG